MYEKKNRDVSGGNDFRVAQAGSAQRADVGFGRI